MSDKYTARHFKILLHYYHFDGGCLPEGKYSEEYQECYMDLAMAGLLFYSESKPIALWGVTVPGRKYVDNILRNADEDWPLKLEMGDSR